MSNRGFGGIHRNRREEVQRKRCIIDYDIRNDEIQVYDTQTNEVIHVEYGWTDESARLRCIEKVIACNGLRPPDIEKQKERYPTEVPPSIQLLYGVDAVTGATPAVPTVVEPRQPRPYETREEFDRDFAEFSAGWDA